MGLPGRAIERLEEPSQAYFCIFTCLLSRGFFESFCADSWIIGEITEVLCSL